MGEHEQGCQQSEAETNVLHMQALLARIAAQNGEEVDHGSNFLNLLSELSGDVPQQSCVSETSGAEQVPVPSGETELQRRKREALEQAEAMCSSPVESELERRKREVLAGLA